MGVRDLLRFYLELSLPDRAIVAIEKLGLSRSPSHHEATGNPGLHQSALPQDELTLILQSIDMARYGGPSFSKDSFDRMTVALRQVISTIPGSPEPATINAIAQTILDGAANGERDPLRLAILAMATQQQDVAAPPPVEKVERPHTT
jgi:hypothetical protein